MPPFVPPPLGPDGKPVSQKGAKEPARYIYEGLLDSYLPKAPGGGPDWQRRLRSVPGLPVRAAESAIVGTYGTAKRGTQWAESKVTGGQNPYANEQGLPWWERQSTWDAATAASFAVPAIKSLKFEPTVTAHAFSGPETPPVAPKLNPEIVPPKLSPTPFHPDAAPRVAPKGAVRVLEQDTKQDTILPAADRYQTQNARYQPKPTRTPHQVAPAADFAPTPVKRITPTSPATREDYTTSEVPVTTERYKINPKTKRGIDTKKKTSTTTILGIDTSTSGSTAAETQTKPETANKSTTETITDTQDNRPKSFGGPMGVSAQFAKIPRVY